MYKFVVTDLPEEKIEGLLSVGGEFYTVNSQKAIECLSKGAQVQIYVNNVQKATVSTKEEFCNFLTSNWACSRRVLWNWNQLCFPGREL